MSLTFSYFFFKDKFCVSACIGKSLARCLLTLTLSRKWHLQLYLTQIVHSNGKIFLPWRKKCLLRLLWCAAHILLLLIFFKEKLCVSAHVSKSLAWTVFTLCRKMLSFGCVVCSMNMGLWKRVSPGLFGQKNSKFFYLTAKYSLFSLIFSQLIFCQVPNCKMLVSANILIISLVWRDTRVSCVRVFKIKKTLSHSVASCQAIENNDLLRKEKTIG